MSEISGFDWRATSKQIARLCLVSAALVLWVGARLLGAGASAPLSYALEVDAGLRSLLGFTESLPAWCFSSRLEQDGWINCVTKQRPLSDFFSNHVHAAESDFDRLNEWLPDTPEIPEYLIEVRKLLVETSDRVLAKSPLAQGLRQLYRQIVFATGWQESCWRQFIKKGEKLTPLASTTGDVGLMQVNRVTWRSI